MKTFQRSFLIALICIVFFSKFLYSQTEENTFIQSGHVYGRVFSNFHYQLFAEEQESAFAVDRAYFGYEHQISEVFAVNIKLDIGSPEQQSSYDILKRYAYFKNAALVYKKEKLTISYGLIDLHQFKVQEKFWGYRYLYKSFQDEHKFGSSADLGTSASYKFNDYISTDLTVMNGEGYNQLQSDNTYKTGFGITLNPFKGLTARIYVDYTEQEEIQTTIATFIGYSYKKTARIGVEYNYQENNKCVIDNNLYGLSVYGAFSFHEKWELFGRYDKLWSNTIEGDQYDWNINKDGSALITGIQYTAHKNVKIALNYQDWYPYVQNIENESFLFMNLEYKF